MPGLPLTAREATNHGCSCSQSRTADQMCRLQSRVHLTAEEQLAAEESLSAYCKPVELYNILQRLAIRNPLFLQRCLRYKIQAKCKRRIQITVSIIGSLNPEVGEHNIFPLYVVLARPVADTEVSGQTAVYRFSQPGMLSNFIDISGKDHAEARFVIPEIKKLENDARFNNLTIIIISKGTQNGGSNDNNPGMENEAAFSFPELEGNCLWGKVSVDSLCLSLGHGADMLSLVNMQSSFLEQRFLGRNNCFSFRSPDAGVNTTCQLQVSICALELGANEASPYGSYSYNDVPTSSLPHIIRLRAGNVLFNYKYYNNLLQKTEVTEDFSCPFCLVTCASFKGLRYHLNSSHDLFNYEFWVTEEYQAVNVSVRTYNWRTELVSEGTDPRLQTFFFCSRMKRSRRSKHLVQIASHVHPHVSKSGAPIAALENSHEEYSNKENVTFNSQRPLAYTTNASHKNDYNDGNFYKDKNSLLSENHLLMVKNRSESFVAQYHHAAECIEPLPSSPETSGFCAATAQTSANNDFSQQTSGSNLVHQNMLQIAKMRKISDERADPRNRALLTKRQFYHSHRAQPMELGQVFSDQDSEDEIDDNIADLEDRMMLDDFVDVAKDEKQIMHQWNSFVRKQRVLADGHIPWACEAFSRLHGQELVLAPALLWCWKLFMVKLWNHSLLDARSFNNCSSILEQFRSGCLNPKEA